jgi:hypothetical protein
MSYADIAKTASEHNQQANKERVDEKAKEIAEAFIAKINCPSSRSPGILSPDGKSFSCISYCVGMSDREKQAVAVRLAESPYDFKVESDFDYRTGDRIIISI